MPGRSFRFDDRGFDLIKLVGRDIYDDVALLYPCMRMSAVCFAPRSAYIKPTAQSLN